MLLDLTSTGHAKKNNKQTNKQKNKNKKQKTNKAKIGESAKI